MTIGPKPPFTVESAHQKVKALQALWNTRDPQRIITAFAPTYVRRIPTGAPKNPPIGFTPDSLVYVRGLDESYAGIVRKLNIQQKAVTSLKLVTARSKTLDIKSYTEYFGAVKHFDHYIQEAIPA